MGIHIPLVTSLSFLIPIPLFNIKAYCLPLTSKCNCISASPTGATILLYIVFLPLLSIKIFISFGIVFKFIERFLHASIIALIVSIIYVSPNIEFRRLFLKSDHCVGLYV